MVTRSARSGRPKSSIRVSFSAESAVSIGQNARGPERPKYKDLQLGEGSPALDRARCDQEARDDEEDEYRFVAIVAQAIDQPPRYHPHQVGLCEREARGVGQVVRDDQQDGDTAQCVDTRIARAARMNTP